MASVGPAQRRLVLGGFGGVQHGLADGPDVGPVPLAAHQQGLAVEDLPGVGDEARRGGLGDGLEHDLVLGPGPVLQRRLIGQLLGHHSRRGRRDRERRRGAAAITVCR